MRDLAAGSRAALTAYYSRSGAYVPGGAPKRFDRCATIVKFYAGPDWTKPAAFGWRDPSFKPDGPEAVVVVGHLGRSADRKKPPVRAALYWRAAGPHQA